VPFLTEYIFYFDICLSFESLENQDIVATAAIKTD